MVTGIAAGTTTITFTNSCGNATTTTVTVNAEAGAVSVSGGGTFCAGVSTTLNATGGSGGTIYYQNTTSNGTSTAIASASQRISANGTYYFRARTALGCWGTEGSAIYNTTTPLPIGGNTGAICPGTTMALTNVSGAGSWTSSDPAIATVGLSSGVVSGVSAGTANRLAQVHGAREMPP